jgi:hypothetical protein
VGCKLSTQSAEESTLDLSANIQQSISDSIISLARATFKNRQLKEVELEKVVRD